MAFIDPSFVLLSHYITKFNTAFEFDNDFGQLQVHFSIQKQVFFFHSVLDGCDT